MSSKNIRPILAVTALAVTLTVAPALAAGPQRPSTRAAVTFSSFWSDVFTWFAGWGRPATTASASEKTQFPAQSPCNGPDPGCAPASPSGTDRVGSGIDPDGRPR